MLKDISSITVEPKEESTIIKDLLLDVEKDIVYTRLDLVSRDIANQFMEANFNVGDYMVHTLPSICSKSNSEVELFYQLASINYELDERDDTVSVIIKYI